MRFYAFNILNLLLTHINALRVLNEGIIIKNKYSNRKKVKIIVIPQVKLYLSVTETLYIVYSEIERLRISLYYHYIFITMFLNDFSFAR